MYKLKKLIIPVFILLFSLTACSDSNTVDDTFDVSIVADFQSISPGSDTSALSESVLKNMNSSLYSYNPETKVHEPSMAESITVDGNTLTVILKDNLFFHNDTPVTVDDVIYSIGRNAGLVEDYLTIDTELSGIITDECFNKIDDKTFTITVDDDQMTTSFIYAIYSTIIVPANYPETEQEKYPISAGPYKFVSYTPGKEIVFEKFDKYYGAEPEIENVKFQIIPDTTTALFAFKSGELDYLSVLPEQYADFEDDTQNYTLYSELANDTNTLFLNKNFEPFQDPDILKAIKYAINKDELIDIATDGIGVAQSSVLSPYQTNYYNENILTNEYNPDLSRKILESKGYNQQNRLSFDLKVVSENRVTVDMANLIKSYLADCYIDVSVYEVTWSTYYSDVYTDKNFDATILQLAGYEDAYKTLRFFKSDYAGNLSGYSNPEYDAVMEELLIETDETKRQELFKEAQEILFYDTPAIFLGDEGKLVALNSDYTGLEFYPYWFIDISKIKVAE